MLKRVLGGLVRLSNRIAFAFETQYDRLRWRVRRWMGVGPVQVLPYVGYGTRTHVYLQGRAVADRRVRTALAEDSIWRNFINTIRRFHTHELPRVQLRVQFQDQEQVIVTNSEGHFDIQLQLDTPLPPEAVWHEMTLELVDYVEQQGAHAVAPVMVPPASADFAVISDLDDTVIQTNIVNVVQAARNTFLRNAHTRLAFPGVAAFYHALQRGTGQGFNPLFYVSTMPNNLFDLMRDFFTIRNIPLGPMFLTNLGLTQSHFIRRSSHAHKLEWICSLIELYDDLPFVLIGDSGEADPGIYLEALRQYPDRVRAIYIRDVMRGKRDRTIRELTDEAHALGVDLVLVRDTLAAALHAAAQGLIAKSAVDDIRAELDAVERHDQGTVATKSPL